MARVGKSAVCINHDLILRDFREEFRKLLVKYTGCSVQTGGWPCGTCLMHLLITIGVKEDNEHNKPVDRTNEFWRAILQIRGEP